MYKIPISCLRCAECGRAATSTSTADASHSRQDLLPAILHLCHEMGFSRISLGPTPLSHACVRVPSAPMSQDRDSASQQNMLLAQVAPVLKVLH